MENKTPFLEQHKKIFIEKISSWKKHSTTLREKFDIKLLNSIQLDVHKVGEDFKNYGLSEAFEICKNLIF